MTYYEFLSIIMAAIACIISLIVWFGQRKLQKESNELQRTTSELSKKQLEILSHEQQNSQKTQLTLSLIYSNGSHRFNIENIGKVPARDVEMELMDPSVDPMPRGEYKSKFPIPILSPGGNTTLLAALHSGTPTGFRALLKWTNPDGSRIEEETYASL
ncbi:MAG: hypothetical protein EPN84_11350 [Legionella sp.]|nr:MAG: hypothetical protein EPN84_11350 [Legionella sp.]